MFRTQHLFSLLFLGFLIPTAFGQTPDYVPTDGLVGWYPFDGNAHDFSANNHDGLAVNVAWGANRLGVPNSALDLTATSNDYVDLPPSADSIFTNTATVACWVKYPPIVGQTIFKSGATPGLYDNFSALIWNQASTGNRTIRLYSGSQYISYEYEGEEVWKHLVMMVEGGSLKIYENGELVLQGTKPPFDNSPGTFRIGASMFAPPYNYQGYIDEFGVWDRALDESEVFELFSASLTIEGCTDPEACNYSTLANIDDESCQYPLVPDDCNAGSAACGEGTYWNSLLQECIPTSCPTCAGDWDGDSLIGITDLLVLLGAFGDDCPEVGCTDPQATNYTPNVSVNDGSCLYPPCLDAQEPGATCDDGDDNTFNDVWDESGCGCAGTPFVAVDGSGPCEGEQTVLYHDYEYQLVEIGEQCWFAENLRTERYSNQDSIPLLLTLNEWNIDGIELGGRCRYGEGEGAVYQGTGDEVSNGEVYGLLYNWEAVSDSRGLCPAGWAVPDEASWYNLIEDLGGPLVAGGKLMSLQGDWVALTELATNSSGFSALPSGFRVPQGWYSNLTQRTKFWSSTSTDVNKSASFMLDEASVSVLHENDFHKYGQSIRCTKLSETGCWDPDGNGLCGEMEVSGCTDETACNYNPATTTDSSGCIYPPSQCCDCDGNDYADGDGLCPCAGEDIPGCIDPSACNYNPDANDEDGSCVYTSGFDACGCELDCEGNLINDIDGDGLCDEVASEGCMDASACNYDPDYQCEGGDSNCIYGFEEPGSSCDDGDDNTILDVWNTTGCECTGQPAVDPAGEGPCAGENSLTYNGQDYGLLEVGDHCWFRENLRTTQFANGESIPLVEVDSVWANTDGAARSPFNVEPGNSETFGELYNWHAVSDDRGLCPAGWRVPGDTMWMNLEAALGMDSAAVLETGLRGTGVGEQLKASEPAWNGTDVSGFTALPGGFRTNLGSFLNQTILGYWWSTKPDSPHHAWYRGLSSMNDGVQRNIFNRQAGLSVRCVKGEQPVLCNNEPGAVCDDGDANTFNDVWDDSGCACAGTDAVLLDGSGPCEGQGSVDYFDQTYLLVEIGDQCWFRENLATDHYANGDAIPGNLSNAEWTSTSSGAQTVYDEDLANLDTYGRLYNWYAVDDTRGLCPSGWHIPTEGEWVTLEMQLGMTFSDANTSGLRGTDQGAQMKSSSSDIPSWDGINISGFSALPGGLCSDLGGFGNGGNYGYWWSGSPVGPSYSWFRSLLSNSGAVYRDNGSRRGGFSVRCLRDE